MNRDDRSSLSDGERTFLDAFERCDIPPEAFHHTQHIKVAWLYLRLYPPLEALQRLTAGIQRFARHHAKPDLYHETITWAFVFLIENRMTEQDAQHDWEAFRRSNSDLFCWRPSILSRYYREETLQSDRARKRFIMPDRVPA